MWLAAASRCCSRRCGALLEIDPRIFLIAPEKHRNIADTLDQFRRAGFAHCRNGGIAGNAITDAQLDLLRRSVDEFGQTVIMVTHEPDIAAHCRRVIRLADGRIESDVRNGA